MYYADLLVDSEVICEVKAVNSLTEARKAQLLHYLKATGLQVGLLLNFGAERVQVKRLVRSR
jgi:GxxExxY protein